MMDDASTSKMGELRLKALNKRGLTGKIDLADFQRIKPTYKKLGSDCLKGLTLFETKGGELFSSFELS
jgi:hypothetical protein